MKYQIEAESAEELLEAAVGIAVGERVATLFAQAAEETLSRLTAPALAEQMRPHLQLVVGNGGKGRESAKPGDREWIAIGEAAELSGKSYAQVRRLIDTMKVKQRRKGTHREIDKVDFLAKAV